MRPYLTVHASFDALAAEISRLQTGNCHQAAVELAMQLANRYGSLLAEANVICANALEKAGYARLALVYWERLVRNWPQRRELVETAICKAWDMDLPEAQAKADAWLAHWSGVYTHAPGFAFLRKLQERGCCYTGCIGTHNGHIAGWLWLPVKVSPNTSCDLRTGRLTMKMTPVATDGSHTLYDIRAPLADSPRPYVFAISAPGLPDVHGSPLACFPPRAARPQKTAAVSQVCIVVPVYADRAATLRCFASLFASRKNNHAPFIVLAMWDHGPDRLLLRDLERLAARGKIQLRRTAFNCGFLGCVNQALALIPGGDIILLNSDTIVHGDWLDRMLRAAARHPDCATVTAMGSDAELMSFPSADDRGEVDSLAATALIDSACAKVRDAVREIPTGVGFCMLVTRKALDMLGGFDGRAVYRGYGEETEFCLRACEHGLKNYGAFNVFVAHVQGRSFGCAKQALAAQNNACIKQRYPEHCFEYDSFRQEMPERHAKSQASRALLAGLKNLPALKILPWSASWEPFRKRNSGNAAWLFILPLSGDSMRMRLRVCAKVPVADMDFFWPDDRSGLSQAISRFPRLELAAGMEWLAAWAKEFDREIVIGGPYAGKVDRVSDIHAFLAPPPLSLHGLERLRMQAGACPDQIFYMPAQKRVLGNVSLPPNILALPDCDDLSPLGIGGLLLEPGRDPRDWLAWCGSRNLEDLAVCNLEK